MKKTLILILGFMLMGLPVYAQDVTDVSDTVTTFTKIDTLSVDTIARFAELSQVERDSILVEINKSISYMVSKSKDDWPEKSVGRYKVYRMTNIYNSLKLDTATGEVTALQIGINDDGARHEYYVCSERIYSWEDKIIGRFELYPTGNDYNFILLDTIYGSAWQVQWSTKSSNRGVVGRIW